MFLIKSMKVSFTIDESETEKQVELSLDNQGFDNPLFVTMTLDGKSYDVQVEEMMYAVGLFMPYVYRHREEMERGD